MFERFTDRARRVVVLAQEQARMLNHDYIGSEHLLLGLLADDAGASHVLRLHDVTFGDARAEIEARVGPGKNSPSGHIPFTPDAKKALEGALRECLDLHQNEIRTEHLLLGLMRNKKSTAAQVIAKLADDVDALRRDTATSAGGPPETGSSVSAPSARLRVGFGAAPAPSPSGMCALCGRDLWDAERFIRGERGTVCDECVHAAYGALADGEARELTMPPRGYGQPRPDPQEIQAIQAAFTAAFSGDDGAMEDGPALRPYFEQLRQHNAGTTAQFVVQRVRLVDPDHARVRFALVVAPQGFNFQKEGEAVRHDGRWQVARSTAVDVLRQGGMQVPD